MTENNRRYRRSDLLIVLVAFEISAAVMGCGPSRVAGRLETPAPNRAIRWSDSQVVFYVLPYTSQMEVDAFGVDLHDQHQMAVEFKVETTTADATVVVVRRHDIALVFKDGTRRYPIDPMKVYEKQRVDKIGPIVAFGLIGGAIASNEDQKRQSIFADAAFDEVRLDSRVTSAAGFLYFDVSGVGQSQGDSLVIEYEDDAAQVRTVEIDL